MKRILILIVAMATLSFTFASCTSSKKSKEGIDGSTESTTRFQPAESDFHDYGPVTVYCDSLDDLKSKYSSDGASSPCDETIISIAEDLDSYFSEDLICSFVYSRWRESFTSPKIGTDVTLEAEWKYEDDKYSSYSITIQYHNEENAVNSYIRGSATVEEGKLYFSESDKLYYYVINDNYFASYSSSNENNLSKYYSICQNIENVVNGQAG